MSGDLPTPDKGEILGSGPDAAVEIQPNQPSMPDLSPPVAALVEELSVPAVKPVDIIREVAAEITPHLDAAEAPAIESGDGMAAAQSDVTVEGGPETVQQAEISLTEMSDQQLANRFDTYLPGSNASSGDRGKRKIARSIRRFNELSQQTNLDPKTAAERDRLRASLMGLDSRLRSAAEAPAAEKSVVEAPAQKAVVAAEGVADQVRDQDGADVAAEGVADQVNEQDRADGFKYAAEARNSQEPQLTDKEFATALLDEKGQLQAIAPEDPRYDDAQNRIRRIDAYRAFVYSDKDKLGKLSRDEALPRLREFMERGRMSVPAEGGMIDGGVTTNDVDGNENVAATVSGTSGQVEAPGDSLELPTSVEPLTDAQLEAELAYLKAESGGDRDHPYGRRIRAINSFKAIRDSKNPTIRGNMSREDAVRDLRAELSRGAVDVPRPEFPTEPTPTSTDASTEESDLRALQDRLDILATGSSDGEEGSFVSSDSGAVGGESTRADGEDKHEEVDPETQRLIDSGVELKRKIEAMQASLNQGKEDGEELSTLELEKLDGLQSELAFLGHITKDGNFHEDDLITSAQRADLLAQAESKAEIDAIRYPGDFEISLDAEAKMLVQKLENDPDNPALKDRLHKIAHFMAQPMYPRDPALVRRQTDLRKELVIPFDKDTTAEVDADESDDENFEQTVRVSGAATPRASIGSRFKAGFGKGMDLIRGGRRSKGSVLEPAAADSGPLPAWFSEPAAGTEDPAPRRWVGSAARDAVPSTDEATINPVQAAVEGAPVEPPATEPAPTADPTTEPELSQARLDTLQAPGGTLTESEAREAARLMSERTEAIKLDKLGGLRNATQEARHKELSKQFPGVLEAERATREAASPPLYSDQQKALNQLRDLRAANKLPTERLEELTTLETAEARYKELSEKSKSEEGLSSREQKELDEMGDTWKDPVVRGKEKEIMDLAESSLDSDKDFANFVDKLQEYSINKLGMFHPAFQEGIKLAVQDFFNRSDSNMTWQEKTALKDVKRMAQEMQKEIVTIMTFKKQIEAQFKKQEELKKEIEVDQELVKGEIGPDDTNKQKAATELPGKYAQLGALNAAINVTFRRAGDANFNYQWRNRRIKRALGLDSLKDNAFGMWDDINRIFNFAKNNFGYTTDNPLSTRRYSGKI